MSDEFGKILVIQQKMIGDVLTSTVLLEALREKFPKAELHYLVNSHTVPVVKNNPFIDKLVFFTPEMEKSTLAFFRFLKEIQKKKYDVVIDVYGKISSNLISLFSGSNTKIGQYKYYTSWIYSDTIKNLKEPSTSNNLAVENRVRLLKPLGIEIKKEIRPKIYLSKKEHATAKKILLENKIDFDKPLLMISLLGSSENKTYPLNYMAELLNLVVQNNTNAQLIFNYLPSQTQEASQIVDRCDRKAKNQIWFDLYPDNLRSFLAILAQCDALLGNEGGAVNMAKALDIPTFSIFSPWIGKEVWGSKNNPNHIGVHLRDYKPELVADYGKNKLKAEQKKLYSEFPPKLFQKSVVEFLESSLSHKTPSL